jgi:phytoene dehydrogenase-like protein
LSIGRPSDVVFQVLGQLSTADPTRAPSGCESVWAYSHLPRGVPAADAARALADRMHGSQEEHAPGFSARVVDRWEQLPGDLEEHDANLVQGTINGGTAQIYQQLVFRPTPGLGRPETPVRGLYLASAAISPSGGVHGACGAAAARAALHDARLGGLPGRLLVAVARHLQR